MTKESRICVECGRAFAGSQKNIQIYVNYKANELNKAIWEVINGNEKISWKPDDIKWVSPKEGKKEKFKEYSDAAFLEKLGLLALKNDLKEFWPKGGPVWDALAVVDNGKGVILVEAKSHIEELKSDCKAESKKSIDKINESINKVKQRFNIPLDKDWTKNYYQSANRIAHLYFLGDNDKKAWLVNIYFCNDPHFKDSPKNKQEWICPIKTTKNYLGIVERGIDHTAEVFLEAIR